MKLSLAILFMCLCASAQDLPKDLMPPTNGLVLKLIQKPSLSIGLTWTPSISPDIVGYRIFEGTVSGEYTNKISVDNVTNAIVSNLVAGTIYYFAATAVNAAGIESALSTEFSFMPGAPRHDQFWLLLCESPDLVHWTNCLALQITNPAFYRLGWQIKRP